MVGSYLLSMRVKVAPVSDLTLIASFDAKKSNTGTPNLPVDVVSVKVYYSTLLSRFCGAVETLSN